MEKGDLRREFSKETEQKIWHDRDFRMYTDDQLEQFRDQLVQSRSKPELARDLTIGGSAESSVHLQDGARRERMIGRIDAELMYRFMEAREREQEKDPEGLER